MVLLLFLIVTVFFVHVCSASSEQRCIVDELIKVNGAGVIRVELCENVVNVDGEAQTDRGQGRGQIFAREEAIAVDVQLAEDAVQRM